MQTVFTLPFGLTTSQPVGSLWLFGSALAVLVAYAAIWCGLIVLRYPSREWLVRVIDPDSHPGGSLLAAFFESVLERLRRRSELTPVNRETPCRDERARDSDGSLAFCTLDSGSRRYELRQRIAMGDLCDVYQGAVGRSTYLVKLPRTAGCGQLLVKEHQLLAQLRQQSDGQPYGRYLPRPVETFKQGDRTVSVMDWQGGCLSAIEIRERRSRVLELEHIAWMFNRTLEALGFIHREGVVHGAVLPPHLLFRPSDHGLRLIGWTQSAPIDTPLQLVAKDYKSWYPPECQSRQAATAATDIYLAAKSMIWLAGGDAPTWRAPVDWPNTVIKLVERCVDPKQSRRPGDAWALHEQFRELWEDTFGPPKFCQLSLR